MRAVIITLDALVALAFFLIILSLAMAILAEIPSPLFRANHFKSLSLDVLAVLEESGRAANALGGGQGIKSVREVLEATPVSFCIEVEIRNADTGSSVHTVKKTGCGEAQEGYQVAYRSFRSGNNNYLMTARSWERKGGSP